MSTITALRALVVAEWILVPFLLGLSFLLEDMLPEPLLGFVRAEPADESLGEVLIFGVPAAGASGLWILGSIGLYRLKPWGRPLYLAAAVAALAVYPSVGPSVQPWPIALVDDLSGLVSGGIIGLALFTDALVRRPAPDPEPVKA
ncbi:MAG TPA: hypothetical protein VEJ18_10220 [Planctomycetota bacterium]|nr:hypothetical protein [Planctomycetota bacterium]